MLIHTIDHLIRFLIDNRKKARIGGADVTSQTQSLGGDRKLFNFLFRRNFVPLVCFEPKYLWHVVTCLTNLQADVNNGVVMVNKETVNPIFEDIPMKVIEENVQPAKKSKPHSKRGFLVCKGKRAIKYI